MDPALADIPLYIPNSITIEPSPRGYAGATPRLAGAVSWSSGPNEPYAGRSSSSRNIRFT